MVSLNLPFKNRRKSEPANHIENVISRKNSITSFSNKSNHSNKRHSHVFSKRFSFLSNNSSDDLSSSPLSTNKDYAESNELFRFKSLNRDKFNKELLVYLKFHGLSSPNILHDSSNIRISMSSSGSNVFLPSVPNYNEEALENYGLNDDESNSNSNSNILEDDTDSISGTSSALPSYSNPSETQQSFAFTGRDGVEPASHNFAIIVSLMKKTSFTNITTELQCVADINWPRGLPSNRSIKFERFELGEISWDLSLGNHNYFVPLNDSAIDDEEEDEESIISEKRDQFLREAKIGYQGFQNKPLDQITGEAYLSCSKKKDPFILDNLNKNSKERVYAAGDYVFILPVVFSPMITESLITEHSMVYYALKTILVKNPDHYTYGEDLINVVRGPPTKAISTSDKPIFVNKIWNDSLSYEISFPKKYITLGAEIPIKMKFAPLTKDLIIKRIKINVLERVVYCSKDLCYEYEEKELYTGDCDSSFKFNSNERVVTLYELRTKAKASNAMRSDILKTPPVNDNLLSSCYTGKSTGNENVDIIGPLHVTTNLHFLGSNKFLKDGHDRYAKNMTSMNNKKMDSVNEGESIVRNQNYTVPKISEVSKDHFRGLYPDSNNSRYIDVKHKLQVALRLSRRDEQTSKLRHYEVMIDTPIYLLSGFCVPSNIDLPLYEEIHEGGSGVNVTTNGAEEEHLPTFEEATSPMNSPSFAPVMASEEHINVLSRASSFGSPSRELGQANIDSLLGDDIADLSLNDTARRRKRSPLSSKELAKSLRHSGSTSGSASRSASPAQSARDDALSNGIDEEEDESESESESESEPGDESESESESVLASRAPRPPSYTEARALLSDDDASEQEANDAASDQVSLMSSIAGPGSLVENTRDLRGQYNYVL